MKILNITAFNNKKTFLKKVDAKRLGASGRMNYGNYELDGSKTIQTSFFKKTRDLGFVTYKRIFKNYNSNKNLTSKYKEFDGKDKHGEFKAKITTLYYPDVKIIKEVEKIKKYFDSWEPYEMTKTSFSTKGVPTTQNYVKGEYWESFKYDQTGKKVKQDDYNNYYHGQGFWIDLIRKDISSNVGWVKRF